MGRAGIGPTIQQKEPTQWIGSSLHIRFIYPLSVQSIDYASASAFTFASVFSDIFSNAFTTRPSASLAGPLSSASI